MQDFFGQIDELRVWRTVRSEEQIRQVRPSRVFWGFSEGWVLRAGAPTACMCFKACPLGCRFAARCLGFLLASLAGAASLSNLGWWDFPGASH